MPLLPEMPLPSDYCRYRAIPLPAGFLVPPAELVWTAEELRRKSWEDLHVLWYKCIMERNIIATEALDARRQGIFYALENVHLERNSAVLLKLGI